MSKQARFQVHINSPSHPGSYKFTFSSSKPFLISSSQTFTRKMNLPPGFRFHPTDEELITHYLAPKLCGSRFSATVISELDINKFEPWNLPLSTKVGEEWYFFCKKDRKYPTGLRTNRATGSGYWKATGKDKEIHKKRDLIGLKKILVFHKGRAPRGEKTNWVMHEYRKAEAIPTAIHNDAWVVCRVFCKNSRGDHSGSLACFSSNHGVENNFRMEKTEEMELFTDLQHEFFQDLLSDEVFL